MNRRLNELEREKEQLRQQLQISRHRPPDHPAITPISPAARLGVPTGPNASAESDALQSLGPHSNQHIALADSSSSAITHGNGSTKPRSLKGVTVTGEEIDELFEMWVLPGKLPIVF